MSLRIGFYICHCGINIAHRVRVEEAAASAGRQAVIYLPQLMGRAMGLADRSIGLSLNLALTERYKAILAAAM